jgi:hypothetical protein
VVDAQTGALILAQQWGNFATDFFVVGDYVGDRRADFAVFRAFQGGTNGDWFIRENGKISCFICGATEQVIESGRETATFLKALSFNI